MKPKEIVMKFDLYLTSKKLAFEAIVIGGAALALLGVISRETQDCDVLDPKIPENIEAAAKEFRLEILKSGYEIKENWLNNGPESLKEVLPKNWRFRLEKLYFGKALKLHTLGHSDLLKSKLFAYCDRGQDLKDCVDMKPSQVELDEASSWVKYQDANPGWPDHVEMRLAKLAKKLGYGT